MSGRTISNPRGSNDLAPRIYAIPLTCTAQIAKIGDDTIFPKKSVATFMPRQTRKSRHRAGVIYRKGRAEAATHAVPFGRDEVVIASGCGDCSDPLPEGEAIRTIATDAVARVSNFINPACLRKFEFSTMLRTSGREQIWQHAAEHPIVDAVAERDFGEGYSAALG